jgi:hypothetical protein
MLQSFMHGPAVEFVWKVSAKYAHDLEQFHCNYVLTMCDALYSCG